MSHDPSSASDALDQQVIGLLRRAAEAHLQAAGAPPEALQAAQAPELQIPRNPQHGDWSTNLAMKLAKPLRAKPLEVAEAICARVEPNDLIEPPQAAPPGFINLRVGAGAIRRLIARALEEGERYGQCGALAGQRALVEFVSANPTGPLHVGHGRNAVVGDTLARLYAAAGCAVEREYYFNDAGAQMRNLGASLRARYLEKCGQAAAFPEDGYRGEYVADIAGDLYAEAGGSKAGEVDLGYFSAYAAEKVTEWIKQDLKALGVEFDRFFSESSLHREGRVDAILERLRELDAVYEKDGALWLRSSLHGDDADRVVRKSDGTKTYLAPDIAYHEDKYSRGYDRIVNVLGGDHHSYVVRLKAAMAALGRDPAKMRCALIQMVSVLEGGEAKKFSKRAGNFITLREIVDALSPDLVRFFFLLRSADSQMTFDLDLAKKQSMDNPYWYLQYAHARCRSLLAKAEERGLAWRGGADADLSLLSAAEERAIVFQIGRLPAAVAEAARTDEPLGVVNYLRDLATTFHAYFSAGAKDETLRCVDPENPALSEARLTLIAAFRQALGNGMRLLGLTPVDRL